MKVASIPYQKTGYFSTLICDYLAKDKQLMDFYENFPSLEGFKKELMQKAESNYFSDSNRKVLVDVLKEQYQSIKTSKKTSNNINALGNKNTFTITTGHQLNIFTGPLYFLYKIVSAINLSEQLKKEYPATNFVPVYWMASEDHDFDEINYFNFKGHKNSWNRESNGAVGRLTNDGLEEVFNQFSKQLGTTKNAAELKNLFKNAYLKHSNLADATRFLANELFGEYGLVIIDGDHRALKKQFKPYVKEELLHQTSFNKVSETIRKLEDNYKIQVNPREINLFYLNDDVRERIVYENNAYKIINTKLNFTKAELLEELNNYPERFSPNVILRPLYQEVVLPNLCYIGGGGELAYWFELKSMFESFKVPFPILLLRNSALLVSKNQDKKLNNLGITYKEIFLNQHDLINKKMKEISDIKIDFTEQKAHLSKQFKKLLEISNQTDKSFLGAVKAQEKKQMNGLNTLEKRLLKAQKRKLKDVVERITILQNQLFPNQSLEERTVNFSEYYLEYGKDLIPSLIKNLEPLRPEFSIIKL